MGESTAAEHAPQIGRDSSVSGRERTDSKSIYRLPGLEHEVRRERLDPHRQPGHDEQAEGLAPVGDVGAIDLRSFGTWAQSGLNQVDRRVPFLRRPLVVDGTIGTRTKQGVKGFQGVADQVVPGALLGRHGQLDPGTVWALEEATGAKNPAGRSAAPQDNEDSRAEMTEGNQFVPESEADVRPGLQEALGRVVPAMSPAAAYAKLREWTMAQLKNDSNKDTKRAKVALKKRFGVALEKGKVAATDEAMFIERGFFEAYWMLDCDQFAKRLMELINGDGAATLSELKGRADRAVDGAGVAGGAAASTQVAGETSPTGVRR